MTTNDLSGSLGAFPNKSLATIEPSIPNPPGDPVAIDDPLSTPAFCPHPFSMLGHCRTSPRASVPPWLTFTLCWICPQQSLKNARNAPSRPQIIASLIGAKTRQYTFWSAISLDFPLCSALFRLTAKKILDESRKNSYPPPHSKVLAPRLSCPLSEPHSPRRSNTKQTQSKHAINTANLSRKHRLKHSPSVTCAILTHFPEKS